MFYLNSAYIKALEDALAVLDKIAMTIDTKDRKFLELLTFAIGFLRPSSNWGYLEINLFLKEENGCPK